MQDLDPGLVYEVCGVAASVAAQAAAAAAALLAAVGACSAHPAAPWF